MLLASLSPSTSHGKGEAASLQGWEVTHHGALGFLLHQTLPDRCCNCFVHLQHANKPCSPWPAALSARGCRGLQHGSDTNPAQNQLLPGVLLTLAAQGDSEGQGVPVDRLNMSWECITAVTKANGTRGCIHRDTPSRNTDAIVPLSSVLFQITPVILYPLLIPMTHKKRCG